MTPTGEPIDPLMSVSTVADLFDVKPATVRNWIKKGLIEAKQIEGYWKIPKSEVIRFGNVRYGS